MKPSEIIREKASAMEPTRFVAPIDGLARYLEAIIEYLDAQPPRTAEGPAGLALGLLLTHADPAVAAAARAALVLVMTPTVALEARAVGP